MKKMRHTLQIAVAIFIATLLCNHRTITVYGEEAGYAENRILVVYEDIGDATLMTESEDESVQIGENHMAVVELDGDMDVTEAVEYYESMPGVLYAQPDYEYQLEEIVTETVTSNDPYYSSQWYLDYLGIEEAWDYMNDVPRTKVRVAVIDTGVDTTHPDLKANINLEYCVSSVTTAYNKATDDLSSNGHGTHIAGTIGAVTNNGVGISGLSDNYVEIVSIQVYDGSKILSSYVINGIHYAVQNDVDVINMSLGMYTPDAAMEAALQEAYDAGIVVVCSAGNDGTTETHYPSCYDSTIGIIAVGKSGLKRGDSCYGADNFISAPGESIYSTVPGNSYKELSGTSMAAGVATGIVANILSVDPDLSVEEVKTIMAQSAKDTYTEGFDIYSGWGVVSAKGSIEKALNITPGEEKPLPDPEPEPEPEPEPDPKPEPEPWEDADSVEGFVHRLYYFCFGREADEGGLKDWTNRLVNGLENGGQVAYGFLFSEEFTARNLSDEAYVDVLYKVFLGREADASGKAYWVEKLENGMSRIYVMNGFSASDEFRILCNRCGIDPGTVDSGQMRDRNEGLTAFVARMYTQALGRNYDVDGLNDWCNRVLNGGWSSYRVATEGFFHSPEFGNRQLNNTEFVKVLYQTFLDRTYDENGLRYWVDKLNAGESRDSVIAGFANSEEFSNLMAKYGL